MADAIERMNYKNRKRDRRNDPNKMQVSGRSVFVIEAAARARAANIRDRARRRAEKAGEE